MYATTNLILFVTLLPLSYLHLHPHARTKRSEDKIEEDKAHLSEELEAAFSREVIENMTAEERDYHYFRIHDFDKNDLLDGLEVFKAIIHEHEHDTNNTEEDATNKSFDDIVEMIDKVLEEDDTNKDGFLSYSEFAAGRRRAMTETDSEL